MDDPQVGPLDRLDQLTGRLTDSGRGDGLRDLPVGVNAARAARLDQEVARSLGQERPQRVQLPGLVDVDPQPPRVTDRPLIAARLHSNGGGEEHLLAPFGVPRRQPRQRSSPTFTPAPAAG